MPEPAPAIDLTLEQAYAVLDVKADAGGRAPRIIRGIASTPSPDRMGHVFETGGATFTNPIPLLLQHDRERPIGLATLTATPDGILFEATLAQVDEPGPLRDRLETIWQSVQAGLIRGVSVAYRVLEGGAELLRSGLTRLTKTEICELSLVTIPANADATILAIKSFDLAAAAPVPAPVVLPPPAAPERKLRMTTAERITTYENDRATKVAGLNSLQDACDGRAKTDAERQKFDDLQLEIKSIDAELSDLRALESINAGRAQPVTPATPSGIVAPFPRIEVKSQLPPGTLFTRYAMAIAGSKGDSMQAMRLASQFTDTPIVELLVKAAVAPATTTDAAWAKPLVPQMRAIADEFIGILRPATIVGKIQNLRRVPFLTSVPTQTAGGAYKWVGEGKPKPVTLLAFGTASLAMYKIAGIIVFTEELARSSSPDAENVFRADMIGGIAQFMDQQFIDPAVAAVAGLNPASITNGVTGTAATGDPVKDIGALLAKFTAAKIPVSSVTLIMSSTNALMLSLRTNAASGAPLFPGLSVNGGTIAGLNVIVSEAAGTNVIALVPQYILFADDGGVTIDASREASVQLSDAPDDPVAATTVLTSLWQENLVGLRAERFCAWNRVLLAAVQMLTGANFTPAATVTADREAA